MPVSDDTLGEVRQFVKHIQFRALMIGAGIGLLVSIWSEPIGYGFLSGLCISIINFKLMSVDAFDILSKSPKRARSFIIGRLIIRYGIMFGFLALIATRTTFNILAAFGGLVFIQVLLVVTQIIHGYWVSGTAPRG